MDLNQPTSDQALNSVLRELVTQVQHHLPDNFVAAYLQGSFAVGDWDTDSDVDFLIVIDHPLSPAEVAALQQMHGQIFQMANPWAQHLEGSYFPKALLRHGDPQKSELWYLDNAHDSMVLSAHDNSLVVRWATREYGIPLAGCDAKDLIDPVSADDLRHEITAVMHGWAKNIFAGKWSPNNRWAQPFAVLSYCRMLHTLETGRVASKLAGAQWAQQHLPPQWQDLMRRAWEDRPQPDLKVTLPADPADINVTLEFIRYALTWISRNQTG